MISIELSRDQASLLWYILSDKCADLITAGLMSEHEKELIWLLEDLVEDGLITEKGKMTDKQWADLMEASSNSILKLPEDPFDENAT